MVPRVVVAVLLCSARAGAALAQDAPEEEEARGLFMAGRAAFDDGRYDEALAHFEASYTKSGRPELLFNIGLSAQRAGRFNRAIQAFEQYLRDAPDATNRRDVEARLDEARASRAAAPETDAMPRRGSGLEPLPLIVIGGSAAVAVVGVVLLALAQADIATVENVSDGGRWSDIEAAYDRAPVLSTVGAILLGVGVAGAALGVVLLVTGDGEQSASLANRAELDRASGDVLTRVQIVVLALAASCSADIPEGRLRCASDANCPSGWTCRMSDLAGELRCYSTAEGVDAGPPPDGGPGIDAGPGMDAGADASRPDAGPPPCDPAETPDEITGVFVLAGATGGDGSQSSPLGSISAALPIARIGRPHVYLGNGRYPEAISIDAPPAGFVIDGGWNVTGIWSRDCTTGRAATLIASPETIGLHLANATAGAELRHLTIETSPPGVASADTPGASRVALLVDGAASAVSLYDVHLRARDGEAAGASSNGAAAAAPACDGLTCGDGAAGGPGGPGPNAAPADAFSASGYAAQNGSPGTMGAAGHDGAMGGPARTAATNCCGDCNGGGLCSTSCNTAAYVPQGRCGCGGRPGGPGPGGRGGGASTGLLVAGMDAVVNARFTENREQRRRCGRDGRRSGAGRSADRRNAGRHALLLLVPRREPVPRVLLLHGDVHRLHERGRNERWPRRSERCRRRRRRRTELRRRSRRRCTLPGRCEHGARAWRWGSRRQRIERRSVGRHGDRSMRRAQSRYANPSDARRISWPSGKSTSAAKPIPPST